MVLKRRYPIQCTPRVSYITFTRYAHFQKIGEQIKLWGKSFRAIKSKSYYT